jgi:hypothetical protein
MRTKRSLRLFHLGGRLPVNRDSTRCMTVLQQPSNSAASLTGAALGANATCAGADHLVAAADRTRDPHKDAAKRHHHPIRIAAAVSGVSPSGGISGRMVRDHVEQFFLTGALQIGYRPVHRFLLDLGNLL